MLKLVILAGILCQLIGCIYDKPYSPLMDQTVYFYKKLMYKIDVNPMFYKAVNEFSLGVCNSKMGPRCKIIKPLVRFGLRNELLNEKQMSQRLLAQQAALMHVPHFDMYMKNNDLIILPSEAIKEYDKTLEPLYE